MTIDQQQWTAKGGWQQVRDGHVGEAADLVLAFGGTAIISEAQRYKELKGFYPKATIVCCSTAGEILGTTVSDETIAVTAIKFKKTTVAHAHTTIQNPLQSEERGRELAKKLPAKRLAHVLVFSDGLLVNGTALVQGIQEQLPEGVAVTGGLVGDGAQFKKTVVGVDGVPTSGAIVLIGLYGDSLTIGYGSVGGWDPFGPERTITKSKYNVLYELDGKPALALYKEYLGAKAKDLPASGLLFPLKLHDTSEKTERETVRTLLAVDEKTQSMTFAGDMPEGMRAQLMKANFDRLIEGAAGAASLSQQKRKKNSVELALLISCVGRKLVLKERVEEEIEAIADILGKDVPLTGFYSYGEICPTAPTEKQCQLHNQTMTITTLYES